MAKIDKKIYEMLKSEAQADKNKAFPDFTASNDKLSIDKTVKEDFYFEGVRRLDLS